MSTTPPPPIQPETDFTHQPHEPPKKSNLGLIIAGVILAGVCIVGTVFAAVLFPVLSQAKLAAKSTQVLSNIKKNSTSLLIYAADHDDLFPHTMASSTELEKTLQPYQTDQNTWSAYGGATEGNPTLAGKSIVQLPDPASTIALYTIPTELDPNAFVGAADSACYKVKASELQLEITSSSFRVPHK